MAKKKQQPQLPAWVWLFTGVVTGLFAAFLVYLANVKGTPAETAAKPKPTYQQQQAQARQAPRPASTATTPAGSKPAASTAPAAQGPAPTTERKFEFYTLLPEAETLGAPAEEAEPKPATAATKADASKTEPAKPAAVPTQRTVLQTGSFQRAQDAEKLRAQLLLLGLPASVQRVEVRPGETWHRVQAGPFTDAASLANAQRSLKDARIQHIVLRMKNS